MLLKIAELTIVLGSQSPRRSELLKSLDLDFKVIVKSIDESIPAEVKAEDAAEYVAIKKLSAFETDEFRDVLIITADTVVVDSDGNVLGKPNDLDEAKNTLKRLSGSIHRVFTGVSIKLNDVMRSFTCETEVAFNSLSEDEIEYYVNRYQPLDKAGSYGIQEWIGRVGVKRIVGTFENVMGLPTSQLYQELKEIEKGL